MKLLIQTLFATFLFISWGCSNEFEVAAPWKDIPVTYTILSAKDSFQYIRVEKAFLSATQGANEIARIADSLYYPENAIFVFLVRVSDNKTYNLTRVDGNLEGFPRQTGIFADSPNWLYKANTYGSDSLVTGSKYKIVIKRSNDVVNEIFGETTIPTKFTFQTPNTTSPLVLIGLDTSGVTTLNMRCDKNAVYFNADMKVNYRENDPITGALINRFSINWPMARNAKRDPSPLGAGGIYKCLINSTSLNNLLLSNLQPTGNHRYFEDFSLTVEGGGQEIEEYLSTLSANSGITGAEIVPTYTNMSEGYGIVTSKNKVQVKNIRIDGLSLKNLVENPALRNLNFKL
jgi:hypothetical protein